jgi:trypsin
MVRFKLLQALLLASHAVALNGGKDGGVHQFITQINDGNSSIKEQGRQIRQHRTAPDGNHQGKVKRQVQEEDIPIPIPRIIGGTVVNPGDYPWFTSITSDSPVLCGASLVANDILITAAHCFSAFRNGAIVGAYKFRETSHNAVQVNVVERRVHPDYNRNQGESGFDGRNDIMILKITAATTKNPIRLDMDPSLPLNRDRLIAMGFGRTASDGSVSGTLLEANLKHWGSARCERSLSAESFDADSMICARDEDPRKQTCSGDSGGSVVDLKSETTPTLVGVVSFGVQCGDFGNPSYFTRVSAYAGWFTNEICERSAFPPATLNCPPPPTSDPEKCKAEEEAYQACSKSSQSSNCLDCLEAARPSHPKVCIDYYDLQCLAPERCGCDSTCSDEFNTYMNCNSGCTMDCSAPPEVCSAETNAYQACFKTQLTQNEQGHCIDCVNEASPSDANSCVDFNDLRCQAPKRCDCSPCHDELEEYLKCSTGCNRKCSTITSACARVNSSCSSSSRGVNCCQGLQCIRKRCTKCAKKNKRCNNGKTCCSGKCKRKRGKKKRKKKKRRMMKKKRCK